MAEQERHREIPEEARAQEHLANERTFLAWVRTAIALIGLGFVLVRVGPWITQAAPTHWVSARFTPVGLGLIIFGAIITLLGAWRYDAVNRQIEAGLVKTDRGLVWLVATAVIILSIALIIYILPGPGTH